MAQYGRDSGRKDLLTKILVPKSTDEALTDFDVHTEIGNLVFAGTGRRNNPSNAVGTSTHMIIDTTSTTLTYLFWELTRHDTWQSRVRAELSAQGQWKNGMPSYSDVIDLPVLAAVINEALRLHPAAPASLPRVVPPQGRVLNGIYIPEKVRPVSL